MKYRCAECHRGLLKPAYTAPESMGGWVLGRVCAEKAGKARPKKRRKCQIQQATAHAGQLDMFVILEREYLVELATAPIIQRQIIAAGEWPKNLPPYKPSAQ